MKKYKGAFYDLAIIIALIFVSLSLIIFPTQAVNAAKDGLFVEGADSPYVNVVVVKQGRENDPAIKALVAALQSQKIKDWVAQTYPDGNVVTVF